MLVEVAPWKFGELIRQPGVRLVRFSEAAARPMLGLEQFSEVLCEVLDRPRVRGGRDLYLSVAPFPDWACVARRPEIPYATYDA